MARNGLKKRINKLKSSVRISVSPFSCCYVSCFYILLILMFLIILVLLLGRKFSYCYTCGRTKIKL